MTISPIERLKYDSLGTILALAAQVTGTKGIITNADIPVIMRDMRSLACTSHSMYKAINDPKVLDIFFRSLAKKYQQPPECFAVNLNIVGSRKWLWERIPHEYAKAYATIQSIYELALDVKKQAERAGLAHNLRALRGLPNSFERQTKTGFMLYFNGSVPSIATPFGEVQLYHDNLPDSPLSLLELFIKRLDATFAGISHSLPNDPSDPNENYIVPISDLNDLQIRRIENSEKIDIAENQLQNEKDKQNLIATRIYGGHSTYKILKIGNQIMPDVTWPAKMTSFHLELIPTIWGMLEKNRLGIDPTSHTKTLSIPKPNIPKVFRTLPEACEDFFRFVRLLDAQPSRKDGSKVLDIGKDYSMNFALGALNNAAKELLDIKNQWHISVSSQQWIFRKIQLDNKPCNLEVLKGAYTQVLSEIGANWTKANFKDYSKVLRAKSEETHQLFVRQSRFLDEARVISRVAESLGICLNGYLTASDNWASEPHASLPPHPRPIYLWIRKDKLELVSGLMNLREAL